MAYRFDAVPKALVAERRAQFVALGIPAKTVDGVAGRLGEELWDDAPGSWVSEWSAEAAAAEAGGDLLLASLCFGAAKYPCLASRAHEIAYGEQLRTYLAAAPAFPLTFERRVLEVAYRGEATPVPVHVYRRPGGSSAVPVVVMLGGVDTWKMDIHQSLLQAAERMDVTVVGVDGPGVGESKVASRPDGDLILAGVAAQVRSLGKGSVGVAAWSFGATWAVKLALTGEVDAAVAIGGPVELAFDLSTVRNWPNGMSGIMGNSLHRDTPFAGPEATATGLAGFRLSAQGLLGGWGATPTPLFVANGANDPYVPPSDTTMFEGRPNTVVRLEAGATHCAAERSRDVIPAALQWLRSQLD
jgi:esterase FrsA